MTIGFCKFCGEERELINSHIIPKCFYQFKELDLGGMHTVIPPEKRIDKSPHRQNGFKEPLMCAECDNAMGKLDGYANMILFKVVPNSKSQPADVGKVYLVQPKDFDYDKLRKFLISLVWRASVSSHPFSLGKYEKIALQILKGEIPDNEDLFLPLIFRRNTQGPPDFVTGIFTAELHEKKACVIKFPNHEIMMFAKPKRNNLMGFYKSLFTRENLSVIEISLRTKLDYRLVRGVLSCRK